jgi:hypothetical protein
MILINFMKVNYLVTFKMIVNHLRNFPNYEE